LNLERGKSHGGAVSATDESELDLATKTASKPDRQAYGFGLMEDRPMVFFDLKDSVLL